MIPMETVFGGSWDALLTLLAFAAVGMAFQDPFQGHIDVPLSMYAQQFRNAAYMGDALFPRVDVERQSDHYNIFGREHLQGDGDDTRARTAAAKQIKVSESKDTYHCPDHAIAHAHAAEDTPQVELGPNADPVTRKTRTCTDLVLLNHDIRVANIVSAAASYPAGNKVQLAGTDQWSSSDAASDPVEDVEVGKFAVLQKTGRRVNRMVMSPFVTKALKRHPKMLAKVDPNKIGAVTLEDLKAIFEIEEIIIWETIKRTAAGVNSFVMGKSVALLHVDPSPSQDDLSFGKTFNWRSAPGTVGGFMTIRGPLGVPSQRAEEISVHWYHDEKVVCQDCGYLIEDAVA